MHHFRYIYLVNLILIIACNSLEEESVATGELVIKITPLKIKFDSLAKNHYEVFTFKNDENFQLITYNNTSHSIEFFDLNEKKIKKRLYLEKYGPKAIADVQGIYYHNQDSIFIYSRGIITIINDSYSKEANPNLFTYIENYDLNYEPIVNYHFRLYYIPEIKSIPLFNIHYDPKSKTAPNKEQISLFDLKNYRIRTLPYFHTEPVESDIEYGHLNYCTISQPFKGDFYVNQIYSPITYHFNSTKNVLSEVIGSDKIYHKPNRNPDDWEKHAAESNFYNQLEKLNDSAYVRFVWNEIEYEPKENGFLKKELSIQLYNANLDLIQDLKLKKNTYKPYSWFIANNKIYLQAGHPLYENISEEELIIHEIELVSK